MIEDPPLLKIKARRQRPTAAQIAAFQDVPSSFVSDALNGTGAFDPVIKPIDPQHKLPLHVAGPALTVNCPPASNLGVLAGLSCVETGDIMVVATLGCTQRAAAGDLVIGMLRNQGGKGFVTDGALRDLAGLRKMGLGCWAAAITPASPFKSGPCQVGYPIQLAGQSVSDGDMIVADEDGVVVVPFAQIDNVIAQLDAIKAMEEKRDAEVANGLTVPQATVDLLASDRTLRET